MIGLVYRCPFLLGPEISDSFDHLKMELGFENRRRWRCRVFMRYKGAGVSEFQECF